MGIMFALMPAFGAAAAGQVAVGAAAAAASAASTAAFFQVALLVVAVLLKLLLLLAVSFAVARLVLPMALQLLVRCGLSQECQGGEPASWQSVHSQGSTLPTPPAVLPFKTGVLTTNCTKGLSVCVVLLLCLQVCQW